MSFVLQVDGQRWRDNAAAVRDSVHGVSGTALVPVVKGNGYGLGQRRLAVEAVRLGADTVAVGTVFEAAEMLAAFPGDVLVLEPYDPRDGVALAVWERLEREDAATRLIRTLASAQGVIAAATVAARGNAAGGSPVRAVVEGLTSLRRFGLDESALVAALDHPDVLAALASGRLRLLGLALHLPLVPASPSRVDQVVAWGARWDALLGRLSLPDGGGTGGTGSAGVDDEGSGTAAPPDPRTVWVSHLSDAELSAARAGLHGQPLRPRIGTRLWLGDRRCLHPRGVVLAVHPCDGSVPVGYRQRSGPRDGTLVVVSGGTAHGVALEAPSPASSIRQRVVAAGTGALEAVGRSLSPFTWEGRQRWFAEPPHLHVSLLWLPRGCVVPAVGDTLDVDVRFTTAQFDAVIGLD